MATLNMRSVAENGDDTARQFHKMKMDVLGK